MCVRVYVCFQYSFWHIVFLLVLSFQRLVCWSAFVVGVVGAVLSISLFASAVFVCLRYHCLSVQCFVYQCLPVHCLEYLFVGIIDAVLRVNVLLVLSVQLLIAPILMATFDIGNNGYAFLNLILNDF